MLIGLRKNTQCYARCICEDIWIMQVHIMHVYGSLKMDALKTKQNELDSNPYNPSWRINVFWHTPISVCETTTNILNFWIYKPLHLASCQQAVNVSTMCNVMLTWWNLRKKWLSSVLPHHFSCTFHNALASRFTTQQPCQVFKTCDAWKCVFILTAKSMNNST